MSMYICDECQILLDDDHYPCVPHPTNPSIYCCESCAEAIEDAPSIEDGQAWDMRESDYL